MRVMYVRSYHIQWTFGESTDDGVSQQGLVRTVEDVIDPSLRISNHRIRRWQPGLPGIPTFLLCYRDDHLPTACVLSLADEFGAT